MLRDLWGVLPSAKRPLPRGPRCARQAKQRLASLTCQTLSSPTGPLPRSGSLAALPPHVKMGCNVRHSPNQVLTHAARAAAKQLNSATSVPLVVKLSDVVRPSGGCARRTTLVALRKGLWLEQSLLALDHNMGALAL